MTGKHVKVRVGVAEVQATAHGIEAEMTVRGRGSAEARRRSDPGRRSELASRLPRYRAEIAKRKRLKKPVTLVAVATALFRSQKQVQRDVRKAGFADWPTFVESVAAE